MGTTISKREPIYIIDFIDNNHFLKSVFPSGLDNVFIGQFGLDQTHFSLSIHVYDKPDVEVKKWGVWGCTYNIIVIHMLGVDVNHIKIQGWNKFVPAPLVCWRHGGEIFISCNAEGQLFEISCSGLIFQKSSTYSLEKE